MRKFSNMRIILFILSFAAFGFSSCGTSTSPNVKNGVNNAPANANRSAPQQVITYNYEIVNTYKHDPEAFTEGLQFYNGFLYESTGGYQKDPFSSSLRKTELETGKVVQKFDLAGEYFGEGLTIINGKIYQLTWKEKTCFVYDLATFKLLKEFKFDGDGWGMTNDGKNIIMTDSTHVLRFYDPETFQVVKTLPVFDAKGQPLMAINELEYIKGEIWSNIWMKNTIVRIDPATGKLLGTIDLTKLVNEAQKDSDKVDVLNGIAYDEAADRIFVTGKLWKKLYEIKVTPQAQ